MIETVHVDRATARRILAGDEAAFRELFDRFFPRLYRFALARVNGDPDMARDVVQQTFCHALEHLDSYRGEAALYTWFCAICRNVLADHFRRLGRHGGQAALLEDHPDLNAILESLAAPIADEPETSVWRLQLQHLVEVTLDALPGRYGDVLEWKYVEGLSVGEIAGRLELGSKAAESLLGRAREAFRSAITDLIGTAGDLQGPLRPDTR